MDDAQDRELMARLIRGDEDALSSLIDRNRAPYEAYARALLRDAPAAEEVVLDAFAKLVMVKDAFIPGMRFDAWFRTLVRNGCLDHLRRAAARPRLAALETDFPAEDTPEAAVLRKERRLEVWGMLAELAPQDKALLVGFALEGKTCAELARLTGLSSAAVRVRLHRIRKRLRKKEDERS